MSAIRPYEGSGELLLTPYNVSNTTEAAYDSSSTTNAWNTTSVAVTTTTVWDHQSNSTDLPSLLPLWAWAAMLVCTILLLSVLVNCVTLTVGWRKQRKTDQVNQRTRPRERQSSSMWIDLENTELSLHAECVTDGHIPRRNTRDCGSVHRTGCRRSRPNILQGTREKRSLIFSEEELAIMKSKLRRTKDDDQHLSQDGCKHQATTSLRLNSSFLHLQPATSSTFKQDNSRANAHKLDLCDTHTDKTRKLSPRHLATASSTSERKVDTFVEMDQYQLCDHDDQSQSPSEQHTLARNLESSTNTMGQNEQMNVSESTQRLNYFDDVSNITVSTFSHYAFNTL